MGWLERRCPCGSKTGAGCKCPSDRVRWRASLRVDGRRETSTWPLKVQAETWLADQMSGVGSGTHVDSRGGRTLFADWSEIWWAGRDAMGTRSSRSSVRGRLDNHILPTFGKLALDDVRMALVQQWVNRLSATLAPRTVRHCYTVLSAIFNAAVDDRRIRANPCRSPSGRGPRLPKMVAAEKVALDGEQIQRLIAAHPAHWRPLILTLADTGLRWSEAAGLRMRYLDLVGGEIRIREVYSDRDGWRAPKSAASRRTVTFPRQLAEVLAPLCEGKGLDDTVFTTPRGHPLSYRNFRVQVWDPAVEVAGLTAEHPTPHDLRHAHASLLASAGMAAVAQARLGHATSAMTANVYTHRLPGMNDVALAIIEAAVHGVPDTPAGL